MYVCMNVYNLSTSQYINERFSVFGDMRSYCQIIPKVKYACGAYLSSLFLLAIWKFQYLIYLNNENSVKYVTLLYKFLEWSTKCEM